MSSTPASMTTGQPGVTGFGRFLMQLLSDRDAFYGEVAESEGLGQKLTHSSLTLLGLCAVYGAAAGAYAGPLQAVSAAIKLPLLFFGTLAICFPGFFVIQVFVGSRLRFTQVLTLVISALALSAVLLVAVVPITVFFLLTGANYYFLELLHIVIVLGAGLAGMAVLHEGLSFACEKRGVYPKKAMTIMEVWAVLFAFVGIQLAWNLEPFVGDRGQPFKVFRHSEGNFYTAIVYSLKKLSTGEDKSSSPSVRPVPGSLLDAPGVPVLSDSSRIAR